MTVLTWLHGQLQDVTSAVSAVTAGQSLPARALLAAEADILAVLLVVWALAKITRKVSK